MSVRPALVSWGRMNSRGCGAWIIVSENGRQLGRPFPTREKASATVWQLTEAMRR